ncbi:c-type cytochrome [Pseudemcibacter aquimaris]|uniref:c-type cytochrome n=1 Tax=Pseudemcibacter aquimaris TaxID=2857064 RepID=UPI0020131E22|nr:cytochrome c [Pseudemcibacter aquimaris]MCC3862056.1 cytochrome c [Pseudemcibacter aquimaris]WDU58808.1 cytochrome c [Pseudemcibacter aquimaris]
MKNYFKLLVALMGATTIISNANAQDHSAEGAQIYTDFCEACHQPGGEGYEDIYPALKGNEFVLGDKEELIYLLLEGRAGMPTFISDLEVDELTTIVNYIRNSWGNAGGEITQEEMDVAYEEIAEEDDGFGPGN